MIRPSIPWIILAGLGPLGGPLGAEPRVHPSVSLVEFTEDGLPVINVVLHSLKTPDRIRTCRFLVSTGQENTLIDHAVPAEFYWDESGDFPFRDATGKAHPLPKALVKRIEVAGWARDGIAAARVDMKRDGSPDLDEPVDGILGMSFLRGTRYVFDPGAKQILWWQAPAPGVTLPLVYSPEHLPLATLRVGTTLVPALVDLGRMGGVDLPWSLKPSGEGPAVFSQAMLGEAAGGQHQEIGRVEAGTGAWIRIVAGFREGMECGGLGQDVWSAAPAGFDFMEDRLTLQVNQAGALPIQPQARLSLPVLWDRSGSTPRLVVVAVKPESPMAKAGCRIGDELIRAGNLSGPTLNRRNLMALMARTEPHAWTVRREGIIKQLFMFEQSR